jgi:hypothetical protein
MRTNIDPTSLGLDCTNFLQLAGFVDFAVQSKRPKRLMLVQSEADSSALSYILHPSQSFRPVLGSKAQRKVSE